MKEISLNYQRNTILAINKYTRSSVTSDIEPLKFKEVNHSLAGSLQTLNA